MLKSVDQVHMAIYAYLVTISPVIVIKKLYRRKY